MKDGRRAVTNGAVSLRGYVIRKGGLRDVIELVDLNSDGTGSRQK